MAGASRLIEVAATPSRRDIADCRGRPDYRLNRGSGGLRLTPFEGGAVDPDAVQDYSDLAGDGHLRLLGADPSHQARAPSLKRRPFLGSMQQDARRFVKIAAEKAVAPSGDMPVEIALARLSTTRRQSEIGANLRRLLESRRVIDRVAESQRRHDADAWHGH